MSRNKATGTRWESACVQALVDFGWVHAERRTLNGSNDRGDVNLGNGCPVVIECKAHKSIDLAAFLDEAKKEAANAQAEVGVAWVKRRGKASAADGYVVMDGATFMTLLAQAGY